MDLAHRFFINLNKEFIEAVKEGDLQKIEEKLRYGADINAKCQENGWPVLFYAIQSKKIGIVKYLLERNPDLSARGTNGYTFLMNAVQIGCIDIVRLFIDKKVGVNEVDGDNDTALILAVRAGMIDVVAFLLENGAEVNSLNLRGQTALWWAVAKSYQNSPDPEFLRRNLAYLLIKYGADVYNEDWEDENIPLLYVIDKYNDENNKANKELAFMLLSKFSYEIHDTLCGLHTQKIAPLATQFREETVNCDNHFSDKLKGLKQKLLLLGSSESPFIQYLPKELQSPIIQLLVSQEMVGNTPFPFWYQHQLLKKLPFKLFENTQPESKFHRNIEGMFCFLNTKFLMQKDLDEAFYDAITNDDSLVLDSLFKQGANINAVNGRIGNTPLHRSIFLNKEWVLLWLIAHHANLNVKNKNGITPLNHTFVFQNVYLNQNRKIKVKLLLLMIQSGASIHELTDENKAILFEQKFYDLDGTPGYLLFDRILESVTPEDRKKFANENLYYAKTISDFEQRLHSQQSKAQQNILLLSEQAQQASSQTNLVKRKATDEIEDEPQPKRIKVEVEMNVDEPEATHSKKGNFFGYDCTMQ